MNGVVRVYDVKPGWICLSIVLTVIFMSGTCCRCSVAAVRPYLTMSSFVASLQQQSVEVQDLFSVSCCYVAQYGFATTTTTMMMMMRVAINDGAIICSCCFPLLQTVTALCVYVC